MPKKNRAGDKKKQDSRSSNSSRSSRSSRSSSRSGSESSADSADDMPSGFTSDSYSDDGSVYVELSWPSWALFTKSLGLTNVQWTGPVGVVRIQRLFGVIILESSSAHVTIVDGPNFSVLYQDIIDCAEPVSIERREANIVFNGSVGQYRKLRRNVSNLLHGALVPMASRVAFDA